MTTLTLAGACLNTTPLNWAGNLAAAHAAIATARAQEVDVLCLPELCLSGYGCEDAFYSDYVPQQALRSLEALLPETTGMVVAVGLPMLHQNCVYNVVALLVDGRVAGFVPKQQLAGDGIHYEPRWFKPWPEGTATMYHWLGADYPFGDVVFEIDGVRLGFEICEDAWNGIRPAQRHYLHNVDVILNPSASHFAFGKSTVRHGIVVEASRAFNCAYVYSNLLGNEAGRIVYDGEILIAQQGRLLARNTRFSFEDFQLVTATVEVGLPRRARKKSFNYAPQEPEYLIEVQDFVFPPDQPLTPALPPVSAPDFTKEEEFYRVLVLALWDYLRKSRSRGFVVSLSGGADSCACAVLSAKAFHEARQALGEEHFRQKLAYARFDWAQPLEAQAVYCVYQATQQSGDATETSARELAKALGATYWVWDIAQQVEGYTQLVAQSLNRPLTWETDDLALQNIQARVRAPGIWMVANLTGGLLLTTSNRSEAAVGYATMDGDTSGGLAPLGGLDKAALRTWLRWAETALHLPALRYVNSLQPTAELRPTLPGQEPQTDERDLMPYPVLDRIERCAIHEYKSPLECFLSLRGLEPDALLAAHIRRFFTLWARNQWKRERYAPCFHLDDANLDPRTWCRFPILSGGFEQELAELEQYVANLRN